MFLSPDTKAEKSTGNQCVDGSANVCNQQVGGSNPSTSSNATEYGGIPEWPNGTDCKSAGNAFGGSNPPYLLPAYTLDSRARRSLENVSDPNRDPNADRSIKHRTVFARCFLRSAKNA